MPDSKSSEPGFESPFATISKIGHFRSLHCGPSWLSCINEYLAIDSGGHVSDLVLARNCCLTRMLPGEAELVSEWTGLPGKAKSVKRFERSNGLDTALYKNYLYLLPHEVWFRSAAGSHFKACLPTEEKLSLLGVVRCFWRILENYDCRTKFNSSLGMEYNGTIIWIFCRESEVSG